MAPLDQTSPVLTDNHTSPLGAAACNTRSAEARVWHKPLLIAHILASVSLIGADLALLSLGVTGALGTDARSIYPAADLVASRVIVPLAAASLVTGVLLGALTSNGLLRYGWVMAKLAITLMLSAAVFFVLTPGLAQVAAHVTTREDIFLSAAQRLRYAIAPAVASALLMLNVVLAVYKPRRSPRGVDAKGA